MKGIALVLALGATAALVVGCAAGPTPGPTAAPPTPSSTSEPTAPAEPEQDPTDPATWIIDGAGVGPFTIGGSIADIRAAVGPGVAEQSDAQNCPWLGVFATPGGTVLARLDDADLTTITMVVVTWDWGTPVSGAGPRTTEGVRLGSAESEVTALAGVQPVPDDVGRTVYRQDSDAGPVLYEVRDGVVVGIDVVPDGVAPYEFCG